MENMKDVARKSDLCQVILFSELKLFCWYANYDCSVMDIYIFGKWKS